ncbi:bifunctional hydroxymethylpyrimidine kinase/phosphomethylpyrimidine kinase [Aeromicrobium massiliense]|uniref:bifunctional hydroxymethylpyrimidine kinase/phosphomethylpyrimidine kinase n=1 Tax=Aeromicrobium massiliense TaxID=1464554 RepID=UPI0002D2DFB4|nr:bifunctional hydroxymethylpyrimidine kinase/phosphomethylpyrimidine kinase [Aeromicrobium massiliense]
MSVPVVLSIAGSDPSGGAGIQADLKTMTVHGVYGAAVLTALTAQNTHGVQGVHPLPADFVEQQLVSVLDDLDVAAVKIGMLGEPEVAERVAQVLAAAQVPHVVLDPVMVATSGHRLVPEETVAVVRDRLLPLASVVTPNVPETEVLGRTTVHGVDDLERAGQRLRALGARAALVKGGHLDGDESVDVLVTAEGTTWHAAPRVRTRNSHGTGCTLSSAVACRLALGHGLDDAVRLAKAYLGRALASGAEQHVGSGNGPVDHLVTP